MDCRCRREGRQVGLYPGPDGYTSTDNSGSRSLRAGQLRLFITMRVVKRKEFL